MLPAFESIGLLHDDLRARLPEILAKATLEVETGGSRHLRWTDASGASIALHVAGDEIVCITPFFDPWMGTSRWQVVATDVRDHEECEHCGGAGCDILVDGQLATHATIQWLHFQPCREWLLREPAFDVEVAACAACVEVYPDVEAFRRDADPRPGLPRLAPDAFIPLGMFLGAEEAAASQILCVGTVTSAARLHNPFGGDFWHLRLESLPGSLDVVAPGYCLAEAPPRGAVALAEGRLVGNPVRAPWGTR